MPPHPVYEVSCDIYIAQLRDTVSNLKEGAMYMEEQLRKEILALQVELADKDAIIVDLRDRLRSGQGEEVEISDNPFASTGVSRERARRPVEPVPRTRVVCIHRAG